MTFKPAILLPFWFTMFRGNVAIFGMFCPFVSKIVEPKRTMWLGVFRKPIKLSSIELFLGEQELHLLLLRLLDKLALFLRQLFVKPLTFNNHF
jgi:hypothetical protein